MTVIFFRFQYLIMLTSTKMKPSSKSMVPNKHTTPLPYHDKSNKTLALVTPHEAKVNHLIRIGSSTVVEREQIHCFVYMSPSQRQRMRMKNHRKGIYSDVYSIASAGASIRLKAY